MPQNIYIYNPDVPVPEDVQHVEIPEGVTIIKENAFRNCHDLQSVTIPDSVTEIGDNAFWGCSGLQSVTIPDSVTRIGSDAFAFCSAFQSITIPDSVISIGDHAFFDCRALQSVTIPNSVTSIGDGAFWGCYDLQSVVIPDSMTEICADMFVSCHSLQSVTIPDSITVIGHRAFGGCFNLQSVTIPDSVTEIGNGAFEGCDALRSVTIPDSVTKIGGWAFEKCTGLQSVTIPDSVTEIVNSTFWGCSALQSVTIPDSVTEIGDYTFAKCSALRSVTIPDSVTEIGNGAFEDCDALQSVTIPDSVTKIGNHAFYNCPALQSVTIPGSVTEIGNGTFWGCSALQSVTIPNGVTEIGDRIFQACTDLRSVTIPDSVTKIGFRAFDGCSNLQSVTIPDSVTEIGNGAFEDCDALQFVTIPDSVTKIGSYAFNGCSGLQSVTIPDGVTEIDNKAFAGCSALQSLIYKGINIAPFINIDGYGVNTFDIIRKLTEHSIPLSDNTVRFGISMERHDELSRWIREYPVFGTMRLPESAKLVDGAEKEHLRQYFAAQQKTGGRVPEIPDALAITARACGIPAERLAKTFDIGYTGNLIGKKIPPVPATACRCYYDREICDMLIRKDRISVMAEAIGLYHRSGHQECYRHLMDFIVSHPDTGIDVILYAVDHAEEIPMRAETTPVQVRQHRTYMENLAEVRKIETKYSDQLPGFKLSDHPCRIDPVSITYDGMTARALDLSDSRDVVLAAGFGRLMEESAIMHGFMNPDAGFWVVEDKDGVVKAQAKIWKEEYRDALVFDNIAFPDTDYAHRWEKMDQFRGMIAAWAMESGYKNIIMGCGYDEHETKNMEEAPIPAPDLTPEEVFVLRADCGAHDIFFDSVDDAEEFMWDEDYDPCDFVNTDTSEQCIYIKKDGAVADYFMQGYDERSADGRHPYRKTPQVEKTVTFCCNSR